MATRKPIPLLEWRDISEIIASNKLELLGRNEQQQAVYEEFRSSISSNWVSISDYLYVTKFNFDSSLNDDNKRMAIRPSIIDKDKTYLFLNDFPYNFSSKIKHYVLWKLSPITHNEVNEKAKQLVDELNADDHVVYINPPALKSVLDIEHGHILIYNS